MEQIRIQIKRLRPSDHATALPAYMTAGAAGMDVYAGVTDPVTIPPGEVASVPTGVRLEIPPGFEAQVRPRSGLAAKHRIGIPNGPGTIDADYRGEIQVIAINLGAEPIVIEPGQRIAQMIVQRVVRAEWQEVSELPSSERQAGGFGHTDKK